MMNCKDFEKEWAVLDEPSRLTAAMEDHRHACRNCSELWEELTSILQQARGMRLGEEPPQRVWVAVRNQLEQEGLIRQPAPREWKPLWKAAPAAGWFLRLPMGLAYAAVFFVAVGVMYLHSLVFDPGAAPPMLVLDSPAPEMLFVRPDTTSRDETVREMVARVPEEHRATFVSNWDQVNSSIQNLQTFVETHPDDPFGRQQLRNAFQLKEHLWETLVRWEEF
ncbi:MAG: anti-sigma factor [Acidobacteria bacterium]|nr:anti-sigma factor [Acidobacteriota bacterium]